MVLPESFSEFVKSCDKENNLLPNKITRQEALEKGTPFRIAVVWLIDEKEKRVLLQRRAEDKIFSPGKLDASVSGAVLFEEDEISAALRETEEEILIKPARESLSFLGITNRSRTLHFEGVPLHSIAFDYNYLLSLDHSTIQSLHFNSVEIAGLVWLSLDELDALYQQNKDLCTAKVGLFIKLVRERDLF